MVDRKGEHRAVAADGFQRAQKQFHAHSFHIGLEQTEPEIAADGEIIESIEGHLFCSRLVKSLIAAAVVGDTVGDPYKDTSSVALNPIIKFTTLFGLLAVEMAVAAPRCVSLGLGIVFFLIGLYFVYRSFYGMRIEPKKMD